MNPLQWGYKKLIFVHNFKEVQKSFEQPFVISFRSRNRLQIICRFSWTITLENTANVNDFTTQLSKWYSQLNHKKLGLIINSTTNSGKSLLADLLISMYKVWEVGTFNRPPGKQVNQFFLDNLINTFVYRCDEMVVEHLPIVQLMKNLLQCDTL